MKRLFSMLAALWVLAIPAMADVIWTPDDDFFNTHYEECEYLGRSYYANGQAGFVMVFETPEAGKYVEPHLENGTELYVSFTMEHGGTSWGVVELEDGRTGWVAMEALALIYDNQSFMEEHEAEFRPYDGSFEALCTSEDQPVVIWSYPQSGKINCEFEQLNQNYSPLQPEVLWTDSEGRVWGRIGYYMAARGWACLSDPGNTEIPAVEQAYDLYPVQQPGASQSGQTPEQAADTPSGVDRLPAAVGLCVLLVCGVTAGLLVVLKRKR